MNGRNDLRGLRPTEKLFIPTHKKREIIIKTSRNQLLSHCFYEFFALFFISGVWACYPLPVRGAFFSGYNSTHLLQQAFKARHTDCATHSLRGKRNNVRESVMAMSWIR